MASNVQEAQPSNSEKCVFFENGYCKRGILCPFSHGAVVPPPLPVYTPEQILGELFMVGAALLRQSESTAIAGSGNVNAVVEPPEPVINAANSVPDASTNPQTEEHVNLAKYTALSALLDVDPALSPMCIPTLPASQTPHDGFASVIRVGQHDSIISTSATSVTIFSPEPAPTITYNGTNSEEPASDPQPHESVRDPSPRPRHNNHRAPKPAYAYYYNNKKVYRPKYQPKTENKKTQEDEAANERPMCNICLDEVKDVDFGLLSECEHCFCWPCITEWRAQKSEATDRSANPYLKCPVCRKLSDFVIRSRVFLVGEEKRRAEQRFRARAKTIPCRRFRFGEGCCLFGPACLYQHKTVDGKEPEDQYGRGYHRLLARRRWEEERARRREEAQLRRLRDLNLSDDVLAALLQGVVEAEIVCWLVQEFGPNIASYIRVDENGRVTLQEPEEDDIDSLVEADEEVYPDFHDEFDYESD